MKNEFYEVTGKTIEIHPNAYYKNLLNPNQELNQEQEFKPAVLPDLETLREECEEVMESIRGVYYENYYGDPRWSQTFTTSIPCIIE